MTDKTFKYAGVSTCRGITKIRFGNDLIARIKILTKGGCDDIDMREMPSEDGLTKGACVAFLMDQNDFAIEGQMAIEDANDKYNVITVTKPKAKAKTKTVKPSVKKTAVTA